MPSGFLQRGGGWVLGQSVLMLLVLAAGPVFPGTHRPPWMTAGAAVALAVGAGFGLAGARVLGRNRTIFPEPNPGSRLIRHGVYRWVRHPLYASLMWLSLGWAAWWASGVTLLAGGALAVFLDRKARHEELRLRAHFPEYAEYARQVRRFLPGIY